MTDKTYYEVLGCKPDATADQIKKAYRRAASKAHPDRNGGDTAQMQKVQEAYECLGDPAKRAAYDGGTYSTVDEDQVAKDELMSRLSDWMEHEPADIIANIQRSLESEIVQHRQAIRLKQQTLARVTRLQGRIRRRGTGENLAELVVRKKLELVAGAIALLEQQIDLNLRVSGLLVDYVDTFAPVGATRAPAPALGLGRPSLGMG